MVRTLLAQSLLATTRTEQRLGNEPIQGAGTIGQAVTDNLNNREGIVNLFSSQLSNIVALFTVIAGIFFLIYFLIAAFEWLQAGGDAGKVSKAQQRMINAAIGMLVMIVAMAIAGIIGGVFGIDILNPGKVFLELLPGTGTTFEVLPRTPGVTP